MEWKDRIARLQKLRERDRMTGEDLPDPTPPATADEIARAEARLGCRLESSYRAFLERANGWPLVEDFLTLLGTEALFEHPLLQNARVMLEEQFSPPDPSTPAGKLGWDQRPDPRSFPELATIWDFKPVTGLLIVGLGEHSPDVAALALPSHPRCGCILHVAGSFVADYPDFAAFWESLVAFHSEADGHGG